MTSEGAALPGVDAARAARWLAGVGAIVSLLGLGAELGRHLRGWDGPLVSLLSLSYEGNLPTWHASAVPLLCALLLLLCAARAELDRGRWRLLALGFFAISLDEVVGLHELTSAWFDTEGVLHFGWVIPATALVAALVPIFVPFLRRLPRPTARRFALAGALYVGGAVGMELPLGAWVEAHSDDDLGYALIDWVEETLEIAGVTLFAATLLRRLAPP